MQYIVATVWRKESDADFTIALQMHGIKAETSEQALEQATALGQQDIYDSHGPGFTRSLYKIATASTT